jgi:hypothetical protein
VNNVQTRSTIQHRTRTRSTRSGVICHQCKVNTRISPKHYHWSNCGIVVLSSEYPRHPYGSSSFPVFRHSFVRSLLFGPSSGSALGTIVASTYQTLVSNQRSFIQLVFIFSSLQVRQTQGRVFIFDGRTFFSPNSRRDVTLPLQHLLAVGQALRDAC